MHDKINNQFSKHYKRLIEDLKQVVGFTPAMEKLISVNISKLENDIINEVNNDGTKYK